ncbi:hypothetical protein BKA70DRAFT_1557798 [Coprinopsis sp. MPI-PUGE-AT-0042]|nr:hypothetical protein BKA70DRAFT_1557798 [Coprinopsis sp. MPI-PUGE-AT-0042]
MLAFASHPAMSSPQSASGPSSSSSASSAVKHGARKSSYGFSSSSASSSAGLTSSGPRPRAGVSFAYQVAPTRSHPAASSSSSSRHQPQPLAASRSASTASPAVQLPQPPATTTTAAPSSSSSSASVSSWTTAPVSSSSFPSSPTPPTPPSPTLGPSNPPVSYDISAYSSSDLLKLLASLLTQIASTNDALTAAANSPGASSPSQHHPASPYPATSQSSSTHSPLHQRHHTPIWQTLTTASRSALGTHSSTLTFHARNIPSITLEAYLLRILKYCPTTNHVFLSLLVYFDRMARLSGELEGEYDDEDGEGEFSGATASVGESLGTGGEGMMDVVQEHLHHRPDGMEVDHDAQMPHTIQTQTMNTSKRRRRTGKGSGRSFVIDSYNIHRLVIAGVTVASKFFSDVFYTNGRYAKVGGLPLHELNQLELQFLLLNDFRLVITKDEMQRYAEQLIHFSRSQANPIVLKVERCLPGSLRGDDESKVRALLEGQEQERQERGSRPHLNGHGKPKAPVSTIAPAPPPPPMVRTAEGAAAADHLPQQRQMHPSHLQPSSSSAMGSRGAPLQPGQTQTPKMGASGSHEAHPSSSSHLHSSSHHHQQQRQGEFSRAYESEEEHSDSDDDSDDDHRDDQSYNTETETEAETDAGETDASGSTTSDEPTVRPRRPYMAGRRESMGSMMSSEADSDAGGRDEFDGPGHNEADGAAASGTSSEEQRKDVDVDVDGVQKTPEVTRTTRQSDRMLVDHMDTA